MLREPLLLTESWVAFGGDNEDVSDDLEVEKASSKTIHL